MLSTDRPEFESAMATLCAAFNTPPTTARKDAYWRAFGKTTIAEFARLVDTALESEDFDGIPTVPQLRRLKYQRRASPTVAVQPQEERDKLLYFANRATLRLMFNRGGLGSTGRFVMGYGMVDCVASPALVKVRKAVLGLVDWFSPGVLDGDETATPALFLEMLTKALDSELDPATRRQLAEVAAKPEAQLPFPAYMARDFRPAPPMLELTP